MSHPEPPENKPTNPEIERYAKTVHNVAVAALIACPILALLPPRKLDIYTIGLITTTAYSANYLVREKSGRGVWQHISRQPATIQQETELGSVVGELQKQRRNVSGQDYQSGWKAERQKEIREDVEEGKGFGDMIVDQIWEVWNQGKVKDEDDED